MPEDGLLIDNFYEFVDILEQAADLSERFFQTFKSSVPVMINILNEIENLLPSIERAVPVLKKTLPLIERSIPLIELFIPLSKKIIKLIKAGGPAGEQIIELLDGNVDALIGLILSSDIITEDIREKFNEIIDRVPRVEILISKFKDINTSKDKFENDLKNFVKNFSLVLPQIENMIKTVNKAMFILQKTLNYSEKIIPIIEYLYPVTDKLVTVSEKLLPMTEKIIIIIEMIIPLIESGILFIENNFSKLKKGLRVINSTFKKYENIKNDGIINKLKEKIVKVDPIFKLFGADRFKNSISVLIYKLLEIILVVMDELYKYRGDFKEFYENTAKLYSVLLESFGKVKEN